MAERMTPDDERRAFRLLRLVARNHDRLIELAGEALALLPDLAHWIPPDETQLGGRTELLRRGLRKALRQARRLTDGG